MTKITKNLLFLALVFGLIFSTNAQRKSKTQSTSNSALSKVSLSGLKFREVGPALTSGRIADFAVHPERRQTYYVAVASGGVWKTNNAGTTYQPIFDSQGSYSIGCVTLAPSNPNIVWVGTGENNNQRSVAYGDGVYKSEDAGKTWQHMGLKNSEHIGRIIVHPENPNIVYVAAIGPLWSAGGDRGLYKTTDGGKTWKAVLTISEHTGVNDVVIDPRNPDILYASAYQRRRHVFTWLGGGPESGIYKSTDAGATWKKINKGLPNTDIGRIGLAISPANPDYIYAIMEAAKGNSGFFRSTNGGASWEKRSGHSTSGNYYSEIVCHPTQAETVFSMDTWLQYTEDGGKTFKYLGEKHKHVDNHAMWVDPEDTDYFLVGCDGGIYESFDAGQTWLFRPNLPITQFYKVEVDNAEPFYNIYGGTQDNFSLGGPSRNTSQNGIVNEDWFVTNGGDGFESQIDPQNPNIVYAQSQYGNLVRYDKQSGEILGIKPREREGEDAYRWNWDAPLSVSKHQAERLYFAANKLFRSENRGNSWEVISEDLTQQIDRNKLPVMGRVWDIDAVAKNTSTSPYGTIVAFDESPLDENLLFVGTDDGLIQITKDGGKNWQKIAQFADVPSRTYVNQLTASQHDKNVVYAAFNNHKNGDFKPYVLRSNDQGKTWVNISNNLPSRGSAYTIKEDHKDPNLLFVGTEFGVFFSNDKGKEWKALKAGLPTIAVRDMAIQARENDLVLATFGRGFYVLDDYSPLRSLSSENLAKKGFVFPVKTALHFIESSPLGIRGKAFQGEAYYRADNPDFGANFTYFIKEVPKTAAEKRKEAEAKLKKEGKDITYPSYETLQAEAKEEKPLLVFVIKNAQGEIIRELKTRARAGVQRVNWDLTYPAPSPVSLREANNDNPFSSPSRGPMVTPGNYSVQLFWQADNKREALGEVQNFEIKSLENSVLPTDNPQAKLQFQKEVADLQKVVQGTQRALREAYNRLDYLEAALSRLTETEGLATELSNLRQSLKNEEQKLSGDPIKEKLEMPQPPSITSRLFSLVYEQSRSTGAPTETQKEAYRIAKNGFTPVYQSLKKLIEQDLKDLEQKFERAGAPYTPGRFPDWSGE